MIHCTLLFVQKFHNGRDRGESEQYFVYKSGLQVLCKHTGAHNILTFNNT